MVWWEIVTYYIFDKMYIKFLYPPPVEPLNRINYLSTEMNYSQKLHKFWDRGYFPLKQLLSIKISRKVLQNSPTSVDLGLWRPKMGTGNSIFCDGRPNEFVEIPNFYFSYVKVTLPCPFLKILNSTQRQVYQVRSWACFELNPELK